MNIMYLSFVTTILEHLAASATVGFSFYIVSTVLGKCHGYDFMPKLAGDTAPLRLLQNPWGGYMNGYILPSVCPCSADLLVGQVVSTLAS